MAKLQIRLQQALKAETLARQRYGRGVEKLLIVLETQRRRQLAENAMVNAKNNLFKARINLFLAIGGDWEIEQLRNRSEK